MNEYVPAVLTVQRGIAGGEPPEETKYPLTETRDKNDR